ncbi:MAG: hypothetical protein HC830_15160 [Bacteroidetes bacterium]|nr:hypothetical protein [Bacteroidota bacterium]
MGTEYQSAVGGNGGLYQVNNYSPEPVYFIQGKNLPVKQVKVSRKSLLNVYPEYTAQIKKLLKESHLRSFKTEFQLVSAIGLINSKIILP